MAAFPVSNIRLLVLVSLSLLAAFQTLSNSNRPASTGGGRSVATTATTAAATLQPNRTGNPSHNNNNHNREQQQPLLPAAAVPEVVYDDLRYRRVCARVSEKSDALCLTIRYPFEVPLQQNTVDFPHPVDERLYSVAVDIVHQPERLDACRRALLPKASTAGPLSLDERVRACLDHWRGENANSSSSSSSNPLVGVWTRRGDLFGVNAPRQEQRARAFFRNQTVVALGASPTPHVVQRLVTLLGEDYCHKVGGGKQERYQCGGGTTTFRVLKYKPVPRTFGIIDRPDAAAVTPADIAHMKQGYKTCQMTAQAANWTSTDPLFCATDSSAMEPLDTVLASIEAAAAAENKTLSIIVDFPIAHSQVQWTLLHHWDHVARVQRDYARRVVDYMERHAVTRRIAFDGLPQHFPTATAAYDPLLTQAHSAREFTALPLYRPEHGADCRGPLPTNALLKRANECARRAFADASSPSPSFNYRGFYGDTWEFANLFWFQTRRWVPGRGGRWLDCTHHNARRPGGAQAYGVHRFFLQAMIDAHYEDDENEAEEEDRGK